MQVQLSLNQVAYDTESFERFLQPKSVEDEKKSVDNEVPKSTAYKTKFSCKAFEEWKQI